MVDLHTNLECTSLCMKSISQRHNFGFSHSHINMRITCCHYHTIICLYSQWPDLPTGIHWSPIPWCPALTLSILLYHISHKHQLQEIHTVWSVLSRSGVWNYANKQAKYVLILSSVKQFKAILRLIECAGFIAPSYSASSSGRPCTIGAYRI